MIFLASLLRGISFVPAVVHGIEALLGSKTGNEKKTGCVVLCRCGAGYYRRGGEQADCGWGQVNADWVK